MFQHVRWEDYGQLLKDLIDRPGVRVTRRLPQTASFRKDSPQKALGRCVLIFDLNHGFPATALGNSRGLEFDHDIGMEQARHF